MNRRSSTGRAIGALGALALTTLLASCGDSQGDGGSDDGNVMGGSAGVTGLGGVSSGGVSNGGASNGGSMSTGGTGGATAGGMSGATSTGGAGAGGVATGGVATGGDAGSVAGTGGVATGGQAGSPGGSAGSTSGGSAGAWWFSGPRTPPPLGTWPPPNIRLTQVATGVTQPTAIASPRADNTRIFVAEKWGRIRLIKDGVLQSTPALDMRAAVLEGGPQAGNELMNQGKRGLVGLAFHPNYADNGRVFVLYVADQGTQGVYGTSANMYDDGDMTIAEYKRSASNPDIFDPMPVAQVLQFDKGNCDQCSQHNGGSLEVDVDGFLWASTGDPPPYNNPGSQDLMNLNGKLLRFDISGATVTAAGNYPGADPYVASIGIRNAYKFSVDRYTGDVFVGDVGENTWEEVSVERYGQRNKNHGWPNREGLQMFMGTCTAANCLNPVYDYGHGGPEGTPGADTCIVGGYVYRGSAIPALQGTYIYGDYGSGKVRALQIVNGALMQPMPHEFSGVSVFMGCFGEDAAGEVYVCDYNMNRVLRVDGP